MKFQAPLTKALLIKRYKRFLADVEFEDGSITTAHCANTGAMTGLKQPGSTVWLSKSDNPKRKLQWSWELIEADNTLVGINTAHPNKLVEEAIQNGTIKELSGYTTLKREQKYGKNSRIDILLSNQDKLLSNQDKLLSDQDKADCYVEVKNVHLLRQPGLAEFPDARTERGRKHLMELENVVKSGQRAVMVYLIQRNDAKQFSLAKDIDPEYAQTFQQVVKFGVEAIAYSCTLSRDEILVKAPVEILE